MKRKKEEEEEVILFERTHHSQISKRAAKRRIEESKARNRGWAFFGGDVNRQHGQKSMRQFYCETPSACGRFELTAVPRLPFTKTHVLPDLPSPPAFSYFLLSFSYSPFLKKKKKDVRAGVGGTATTKCYGPLRLRGAS